MFNLVYFLSSCFEVLEDVLWSNFVLDLDDVKLLSSMPPVFRCFMCVVFASLDLLLF